MLLSGARDICGPLRSIGFRDALDRCYLADSVMTGIIIHYLDLGGIGV